MWLLPNLRVEHLKTTEKHLPTINKATLIWSAVWPLKFWALGSAFCSKIYFVNGMCPFCAAMCKARLPFCASTAARASFMVASFCQSLIISSISLTGLPQRKAECTYGRWGQTDAMLQRLLQTSFSHVFPTHRVTHTWSICKIDLLMKFMLLFQGHHFWHPHWPSKNLVFWGSCLKSPRHLACLMCFSSKVFASSAASATGSDKLLPLSSFDRDSSNSCIVDEKDLQKNLFFWFTPQLFVVLDSHLLETFLVGYIIKIHQTSGELTKYIQSLPNFLVHFFIHP